MSNVFYGNQYSYIVDTSYGINQDGFIAIGTESIVYKGLRTKHDGGLPFSCVLKFKPKAIVEDGKTVDRLKIFKEEEWTIFEALRECRSIVKIDDVIEDLGDFSLTHPLLKQKINRDYYFCVVEEFIDGWNLDEYCQEEFWKLRRKEPVGNGLLRYVNYPDFSAEEKEKIKQSYHYDNVLKYQNQILQFMVNLCEILQFVSEQKQILHLDIKPDNIMVTRYGKELVLIDFGRSRKITRAESYTYSTLPPVNYQKEETLQRQYQHGTTGYAAPECFCEAVEGSKFPFEESFSKGKMSIESDIFSFGASFWECLNIYELVTKTERFSTDNRAFYQEHFLQDSLYTDRDLNCTSTHYHKRLENIIKKCTRHRTSTFTDPSNKNYYHSYADLKHDLEEARESVPTIIKEENVRVRNAFRACASMFAFFLIFVAIFFLFRANAYDVAREKWNSLTVEYNDTQFYRLEDIATDLVSSAPANQVNNTYDQIAKFTYQGNDISEYEAALLVSLMQQSDRIVARPQKVDEIMQYANTRKFKEITSEIVKLDGIQDSVGYELAQAIYHVEVGRKNIVAAYDTLQNNRQNEAFHNAIVKLKNVLDDESYIREIAEAKGVSRIEINDFLQSIV